MCKSSLTHSACDFQNGLYCHNCYLKINGPTKVAYFMADWKINQMRMKKFP